MAAKYGVNFSKLVADPPRVPVNVREYGARVRTQIDKRVVSAADDVADGDTIAVARIPKGAVILGGELNWTAMGAGGLLKVGDAGDDDRFMAQADSELAGRAEFAAIAGKQYEVTADGGLDVLVTVVGDGAEADFTILSEVRYVEPS